MTTMILGSGSTSTTPPPSTLPDTTMTTMILGSGSTSTTLPCSLPPTTQPPTTTTVPGTSTVPTATNPSCSSPTTGPPPTTTTVPPPTTTPVPPPTTTPVPPPTTTTVPPPTTTTVPPPTTTPIVLVAAPKSMTTPPTTNGLPATTSTVLASTSATSASPPTTNALPATGTTVGLNGGPLEMISVDGTRCASTVGSDYWSSQVSSDGRYVLFLSGDPSLDPTAVGAPSATAVYLRDRFAQSTKLVSVNALGQPFNSRVVRSRLAPSGQAVTFLTDATNVLPGGNTSGFETYVKSLVTGEIRDVGSNQYLSIDAAGTVHDAYSVTPDGRYEIVAGYLLDTLTGTRRQFDVSADTTNFTFFVPAAVSNNGRYVAFSSNKQLVPGVPSPCAPNICQRIYRTDLLTGVISLVDVDQQGQPGAGDLNGQNVSISGDGNLVGFTSMERLVQGQPANEAAFVRNMAAGSTLLLGSGGGDVEISNDGSFASWVANLQTGPPAINEIAGRRLYVVPPVDILAPTITLTTPAANAVYSTGSAVTVMYACVDDTDPTPACVGNVPTGSLLDTSAPGSHQFSVTATDHSGNSATTSVAYTVQTTTTQTLPSGGGTVAVGTATAVDPIAVNLTTAVAGTVSMSVSPTVTQAAPSGYQLQNYTVSIAAPPATIAAPMSIAFDLNSTLLIAGGVDYQTVQIFRDGVALGPCSTGTPPCVANRTAQPNGDAVITILTDHASTWNIGRKSPYVKSGPFAPVTPTPVYNSLKAGAAVPVKFTLGGDQGLNIFAWHSPSSLPVSCQSGAAVGAITQTVFADVSKLQYDSSSGQYIFVWKTDKAWTGCRELRLRFIDGSTISARFLFH